VVNENISKERNYLHWLRFDAGDWCRYNKLMLERVYFEQDSGWLYQRLQVCLDTSDAEHNVLYAGEDVVRLMDPTHRGMPVRSGDPRVRGEWKPCGAWKRLRHGADRADLWPERRKSDQLIMDSVEQLNSETPLEGAQLPTVWVTVKESQLGDLSIRKNTESLEWLRHKGVKSPAFIGTPLIKMLASIGEPAIEGRIAFPFDYVSGRGVVAVKDVPLKWFALIPRNHEIKQGSFLLRLE